LSSLKIRGRNIACENYINFCFARTNVEKTPGASEPKDVVANWMRLRNTIEYLGIWEKLNNRNFKRVEFDAFINNFIHPGQRFFD